MRQSELPRRGPLHETLDGELLVSRSLKDAIESIHPRGLELREAVGEASGAGTGFFQLLAPVLESGMSVRTEGVLREDQCQTCHRDGHFDDLEHPAHYRYAADTLPTTQSDVYFTYECFGNSKLREPISSSSFAHPLLLISTKLYELLVSHRVPSLKCEPVSFTPCD